MMLRRFIALTLATLLAFTPVAWGKWQSVRQTAISSGLSIAVRNYTPNQTTSSVTSLSGTLPSGILAGSIVVVVCSGIVSNISSISDSASDTVAYAFSPSTGIYDGNSFVTQIGGFFAPTTGVTTFTCNLSSSAPVNIGIYEVTGYTSTPSFDGSNNLVGQVGATNVTSNATATLAIATEFAVGYATDYSAFTGVGAGWTNDGTQTVTFDAISMHQITTTTAAVTAIATSAGSAGASGFVATVKQ